MLRGAHCCVQAAVIPWAFQSTRGFFLGEILKNSEAGRKKGLHKDEQDSLGQKSPLVWPGVQDPRRSTGGTGPELSICVPPLLLKKEMLHLELTRKSRGAQISEAIIICFVFLEIRLWKPSYRSLAGIQVGSSLGEALLPGPMLTLRDFREENALQPPH